MRSPIIWFGGKGVLVKRIMPYISEHREYVEPYFGGGSVLFAKRPAKVETINDIDSGVMNFYRVLRDEPEEFIRLCQYTPWSRELFGKCKEQYKVEEDPVRRAWMFFVVARQSFGGIFGSGWGMIIKKSRRGMASTCSGFLGAIDGLPEVAERLKKVQIENSDALKVIEQYATDSSLIYCDPPYVTSTRRDGGYTHEMDDTQHEDLLELLNKVPGKVVLSGYNSELYADYLGGWRRVDIETSCHAAGRTRASNLQGKGAAMEHQKRTESIWLNTAAAEAVRKQQVLFA